MPDEAVQLSKTLAWAVGMIEQSGPSDREHIAAAYTQAQQLVASITTDNGDARPRIVACFKRSDEYRAVEDIACIGWILTAMEERVNERDLASWRTLRNVIRQSLKLLPIASSTVH